jgi:uncharacterized protein YfaS (alpha-2-macroglobulin family)
MANVVASEWGAKKYTSTQEQTWMLLAARALQKGDESLRLDVNGAAHTGALMSQMMGDVLLDHPLEVRNDSDDVLSAAVTTVAAPANPPTTQWKARRRMSAGRSRTNGMSSS